MIALLVVGVGMGASATGESPTGVARLMMMGVGRMWWITFLFLAGAYHG